MKVEKVVLLTLLFFVCLDLCLINNITDMDVWARLAVGKLFLELGHVSHHDIFAYTPTKPLWVDHEWGSGVIFFLLADAFGEKGLLLLRAALYFGTVFWLYRCVNQRQENACSVFLHGLLAYALLYGFYVTIRSQAFTYFFFSLWLNLLERSRRGKVRVLIYLPVTMVLWANLHAGFVSGLGLLCIYGAGELLNRRSWARYFLFLLPCLLVTLANPYGVQYWGYIIKAITMPRPMILEWRPFDFLGPIQSWLGFKLLFCLSGLLLLATRVKRVKIDWVDILLLSVTGILTIRHARHATFFCIACFPFVYSSCRHFGTIFQRKHANLLAVWSLRQKEWARTLGCGISHGLLLALAVLLACTLPFRIEVPSWLLPVRAVEFIRQNHLEGNLLTQFDWGSYAIWRLFPRCRVAIDGRYEEVYPDSTYYDIHRFTNGKDGWEKVLEKYGHELILVRRTSPIVLKLKQIEGWRVVYTDDLCKLYLPAGTWQGRWVFPDENGIVGDQFSADSK